MNIDSFKRVCVVGWGRSGIALANLLLALGKKVRVSEQKERNSFAQGQIDSFAKQGVEFEFGSHSENFIKTCDLAVVSPGVDTFNSQAFKLIQALEIPAIGEIEFSFWLTKADCVAITGTNGKTTTTHLTYEVLRSKRKRVFLGGNIGTPFASFVLQTKKNDLVVLELSSFQLETIIKFRPRVAALLNITPDHLDRYKDFAGYLGAKMNIFRNQTADDYAVLNKDAGFNVEKFAPVRSKILYFSDEFPNENLSCVYRIARIYGLSKTDCQAVFSKFRGLPHRMQLVRNINGITFVNDSKATNPSSTVWALKNTKGPVILLAGGKDKGLDYSEIVPYIKRVKKINVFGQAAQLISDSLKGHIPIENFPSFKGAIEASLGQANTGDTVILSPMCSSYDMFKNYEERGDKFIEIVNNLKT